MSAAPWNRNGKMIVTIDGPAGAGKSSAARALAARLGFRFLDTGAMYRAVTYAALQRNVDLADADALAELVGRLDIRLTTDQVLLDGEDVATAIRTFEITAHVHFAADNARVRAVLVELQRAAAAGSDVVTEGRDQGTVVFPDAACKIFLTASAEERARRRLSELATRGENATFEDVLIKQNQRDLRDAVRECGPLVQADDAIEVSTDGMTAEDVVDRLTELVDKCR